MEIKSSAFDDMGKIPSMYTCDGENINPPLQFIGVPSEARSLALIVSDPDAPSGDWVHWVVYNIDPKSPGLGENSVLGEEGITSFGRAGYGGPCPPSGAHRYVFDLYAVDTEFKFDFRPDKLRLLAAMQGHVIDGASITGLYTRL